MEMAGGHKVEPLPQRGQLTAAPAHPSLIADVAGRTGYRFRDERLLVRALTHRSAAPAKDNNEALEFLGDRVLALVIAEHLHRNSPAANVGSLSQALNKLVCADTLAEIARELGIAELMRTDAGDIPFAKMSVRMLADVCEALIAAIYLDGGLAAARAFIHGHWQERLGSAWRGPKDAKTALQEWSAARALGAPVYREVSRVGPAHGPSFSIEVVVSGLHPAYGQGNTKRQAEQRAAEALLKREGAWPDGA